MPKVAEDARAAYRPPGMEILTAAAMRRVDARAIGELGTPGATLMDSAGRGVADALLEEIPGLAARRVVVFCGKGNNGGDGLVAACHLVRAGVSARAVLLARRAEVSGLAAGALANALDFGLAIDEISDERSWARQTRRPKAGDVEAWIGAGRE